MVDQCTFLQPVSSPAVMNGLPRRDDYPASGPFPTSHGPMPATQVPMHGALPVNGHHPPQAPRVETEGDLPNKKRRLEKEVRIVCVLIKMTLKHASERREVALKRLAVHTFNDLWMIGSKTSSEATFS